MPFIEALGQQAAGQAAGNAINEAMGIAFQPIKNKQQAKQARKLQDIQLEGEATRLQRNEALAMRMWENTGFKATKEQIERAGMNAGLLYGMGGGAGGTTAQAPSSGGTATAETARASHGSEGMGIQLALIEAQRKNIEADTKQKEAETAKTSGVDTEKTKTETSSIAQGITNAVLQNEIMQYEKSLKEMENSVQRQTLVDRMEYIEYQTDQAKEALENARRENNINEQTKQDKIKQIQAQSIGAVLANGLTRAQTDATTTNTAMNVLKTNAEIEKMAQEIAQGWKELNIKEKMMKVDNIMKQVEQTYKTHRVGFMPWYNHDAKKVSDAIDKIMQEK